MSAVDVLREPIPVDGGGTGAWCRHAWCQSPDLLSFREAAWVAGVSLSAVKHAHRAGRFTAQRRCDGVWVVTRDEAAAYGRAAEERRARVAARRAEAQTAVSPRRVLPAEPLLRQVALRGGPAACTAEQGSAELEALRLAKLYGRVTPRAADHLTTMLCLTVWDLWPDAC